VRILVLGATGGTGREIVQQLKQLGHTAVALVRSSAKAGALDAILVEGDARDETALGAALANCDAVISALGTPASPSVKSRCSRRQPGLSSQRCAGVACDDWWPSRGIGAGDSLGHGGFQRALADLLSSHAAASGRALTAWDEEPPA
jgi:NAD(P)-dependent dehydrogenase (short-subunit alcohol dehydrogenase family)